MRSGCIRGPIWESRCGCINSYLQENAGYLLARAIMAPVTQRKRISLCCMYQMVCHPLSQALSLA